MLRLGHRLVNDAAAARCGSAGRARSPEDERQVRVSLTERGKALEAEARRHAGAQRLARAFGDPDRAKALKRRASSPSGSGSS